MELETRQTGLGCLNDSRDANDSDLRGCKEYTLSTGAREGSEVTTECALLLGPRKRHVGTQQLPQDDKDEVHPSDLLLDLTVIL